MEWFIPVEIFRKKSNTFQGITFFPFLLPRRPTFFTLFVWLMSARLPLRGKMIFFNPGSLVIWCFANGTTPTHSLFQKRFQVQYHLSEIFYRNFPTNGKCSGFFLWRGAQLRNGITDWWYKQSEYQNTSCIRKAQVISGRGEVVWTPETYNDPISVCTQPYNPGQNSWDTKATVHQIEASSLPPFPSKCSVDVMHSSFNSRQSTLLALGERGTEIAPYNNIPRHL